MTVGVSLCICTHMQTQKLSFVEANRSLTQTDSRLRFRCYLFHVLTPGNPG